MLPRLSGIYFPVFPITKLEFYNAKAMVRREDGSSS
jgi:hypothetical protein